MASQRGGIGEVIAIVVSIILVLGLISYALIGQVAAAKEMGDKSQAEQQKLAQMLQDPNLASGSMVMYYIRQVKGGGASFDVTYVNLGGDAAGVTIDSAEDAFPSDIKDSSIYAMSKEYDASGNLSKIKFVQKS